MVMFLSMKSHAFDEFAKLCRKVQNEKGYKITCIRSDNGTEYVNSSFVHFCDELGIEHVFSAPRTPQQNGVVERKNRTLQEMARTMLKEHKLPTHFWGDAVNTTCYVLNRVSIRPLLLKTPYELWNGRVPKISYFRVFGCKCFILNTRDYLGKFDAKSDEGIFLGYSIKSKAYRVYNKRTNVIEESMHVDFDETNPFVGMRDDEHVDEVLAPTNDSEDISLGESSKEAQQGSNDQVQNNDVEVPQEQVEDIHPNLQRS